jgi:hypothetical protein
MKIGVEIKQSAGVSCGVEVRPAVSGQPQSLEMAVIGSAYVLLLASFADDQQKLLPFLKQSSDYYGVSLDAFSAKSHCAPLPSVKPPAAGN